MAYHDPVMTSIRPRLVVLKGAVPLDSSQVQALKSVFEVIEVHSAAAAKKMLDGSVGGVVVCAPGEYLTVGGEPLPTAASSILERIGEGIGVVDASGAILWTDARFKVHDEPVRSEFVRICRVALDLFNKPADQSAEGFQARRQCKRFSFATGQTHYELIVCPASLDQALDRVTSVVGVLWDVTALSQLRRKFEAVQAAGARLLEIQAASIDHMNMAERLKLLEQTLVNDVREALGHENFEIRLLNRETGQLELVIARNISPLKIGEVIHANLEGNGISGHVAATGKSYICSAVQNDALYREGLENAASSLTVPLLLQNQVVGTLNIESSKRSAFDENDRQMAELYGHYIATAMHVLELLVIERYTTNQQVAENMVSELSAPLKDLADQAAKMRETSGSDLQVREDLDGLIRSIAKVRERLESGVGGPRTILGAEQELQRHEIDPRLAGKRILVADDEPGIRDTLHRLLQQKGAVVTVCSNGAQTIEALEASKASGSFDLVVSDIKMPDRNGYEVYRTAKSINPDTPVILMTGFGYDPHHCIVRASQEGLQSFLFKPFKASQLIDVITKSLAAASAC
ncbi:MAG: response regulator [Phycisphaerales bacterium]|nr:response regulator [Phycisphaerales bacterium]